MTFEGFHNRGYFTSSRSTGGRGWDKIYSFSHPEMVQTVKGWVYEADGYELPEAEVYIVGSDGTNLKLGVMPDGSFETKVMPSVDYVFLATCKGYLNANNQLTTDTITTDYQYVLQFPLASVTIPVIVRNVFFEFDKADITPESAAALERLVTMLSENPGVTIELSAHTDSRGNDNYNKKLSQRRAESVVNYLISRGIEPSRLAPVGYGESMPKVVNRKLTETYTFLKEGDILSDDFINKLPTEQQDSCHALNRRTQFRVLRTTYKEKE
jgi:outer membrane protein OmpA-like peptidoglycan-associated protein